MDDFFAELEAEIAVATAKSKLKADRDAAKKKANNTSLPYAARQRAGQEYKELAKLLEAEEWFVAATVALFTEQECDGCGSTHRVFLQFMERQCMVKKPSTQRWVRTPKPLAGAPLETLIQPHRTHICSDCCHEHGFVLLEASRLEREAIPTISNTYHQEDVNAPSA